MKNLFIKLIIGIGLLSFGQSIYGSGNQISDSGQWTMIFSNTDHNTDAFQKIFFVNENIGYAVGQNGTIVKTEDSGNSWSFQNSGVTVTLHDVYFANANTGYAVGNREPYPSDQETVIKTTDGGSTWTKLTLDNAVDKRDFLGVHFTDVNTGFVVGKWGTIVKTTDGGQTWTRRSGSNDLLDITFVNSTTGFAVGNNSTILKTTDGGTTWVQKESGNVGIYEVFFLNENVGFVAGRGNLLEKTTDGGENWVSISDDPFSNATYYSICFTDINNGYASEFDDDGNPYFITTSDGGQTWNYEQMDIKNSIIFPTQTKGFAVSGSSIYRYNVSSGSTATLNGKVTNALDGTPIPGALVEIAGLSTTTDSDGNYEITDIPEATLNAEFSGTPLSGNAPLNVSFIDQSSDASYTLVVSATGYSTYTNTNVVIAADETLSLDISLSPTISSGEMRIVLNWGSEPNDLDSYLKTPEIEGNNYTVYYGNTGNATSPPYATLDHDEQQGFGPETITIYQKFAGTYKYYVRNYSGTPDITTSNAVVQVYDANGLISSINIPTEGSGRYWNVLTIDGTSGDITIINEISDSAPPSFPAILPEKVNINEIQTKLNDGRKSITSWSWNFGDGSTSTEQNPTHTYTAAGNYTVTLTVSNGTLENTEIKTNYINVTGPTGGTILEENFDGSTFPPNGWTQKITNSGYTWQQGNPSEHNFTEIDPSNVNSAICPWVAQNQDEWLKTPILTFPNDIITLNFYAGFSTNWLTSATLKLNVSVDGGASWTNVWEANNDGNGWTWREISVDLSQFSNHSNVIIAWQYVGNDGDLVGIDNVKLTYGVVGVNDENQPLGFELKQNYPNPFNPTTEISFDIPKESNVKLSVYNSLGQKVADLLNEKLSAGTHRVKFDGSNLSSGIYYYRMQSAGFMNTKKMILIK